LTPCRSSHLISVTRFDFCDHRVESLCVHYSAFGSSIKCDRRYSAFSPDSTRITSIIQSPSSSWRRA
jgi:hypothetical protein